MQLHSKPMMAMGSLLLALSLFFYACQKDTVTNDTIPNGKTKLAVYLTDGPTDYQHVLVDIQQIAVKVDTCMRNSDDDHDQPGCDDDHDQRNSNCEIWDTINIRPGVYDLLQLRNGLDTLLASDFVLTGKIKRIKFTLGDNNTVIVDSTSYPIRLLNNQHFVYVNIKRDHLDSLSANNLQLYLDFDLNHSIKYRNGEYWLKPVIKPFGRHSTGEIEGKIMPQHSFGLIKAFNSTDTAYAIPWSHGEFKIRGLNQGTYSLYIQGANGYSDTTLTNIQVNKHEDTNVGTIQLHQ